MVMVTLPRSAAATIDVFSSLAFLSGGAKPGTLRVQVHPLQSAGRWLPPGTAGRHRGGRGVSFRHYLLASSVYGAEVRHGPTPVVSGRRRSRRHLVCLERRPAGVY